MFGLGKRIEDAGMMEEDDRITYVDRSVYIVLAMDAEDKVEVRGAFMSSESASLAVGAIKGAGGYAWYRDAVIHE